MKYKVGDKVRIKSLDWYNKNKDYDDGIIYFGESFNFTESMSKCCGQIATITHIIEKYDEYKINLDHGYYDWTDDMIEGLAEEETKPKFNVGDIIAKAHLGFRIIKVEGDRYIVEGTPGIKVEVFFKDQNKYRLMEDGTKPLNSGDSLECPQGYQFVDENGNVINTTKIVLEKNKKEYPKTYEECAKELGYNQVMPKDHILGYRGTLLSNFQQLLICRDAYWKIAGEEMRLGKPWKPDWTNNNEVKFVIGVSENEIIKCCSVISQYIFAFPTKEMRDAFYENFKELIEQCKELL